jgi:hypothetical protein
VKGGGISGKKKKDTGKWFGEFEVNLTDKNIRGLYRDINVTKAGNL